MTCTPRRWNVLVAAATRPGRGLRQQWATFQVAPNAENVTVIGQHCRRRVDWLFM